MTFMQKNPVLHKGWYFLQTYVLTLARFDLFLQGSLLISILLETNILLLLRRNHSGGYTPADVEDWVILGSNGAEFLLGPILAWWGRDKRNLALTVTLAAASVTGFLVLLVPFVDSSHPYVELCGGEPVMSRSTIIIDGNVAVRTSFLVIAAVFCTLAKASIWAHGLTYLDDHQPDNGPYFYGILISIRMSLGLSGQGWLQDASLSHDWWKAHISLCSLTLMFAILFTLFPRQMKEFSDDEMQDSTEYFKSLERLVKNKALVLQTVALGLLTTAVFGFVHYDRAYVQAKFHVEAYRQDPQTSRALSDIFRSLVIIFFVMIFRVRFSTRRYDGVKATTAARVGGVVAVVVAAILVALAALHCDLGRVEGLEGGYQQPGCSGHCGCDSAKYGFSPVCAVQDTQATFFSPCHAGCSEFEDWNGFLVFERCACAGSAGRAVRGACSVAGCRLAFSAYQVLYTVMLAVSAAALLMQGMAILRTVQRLDKPHAVGLSFSTIALAYGLGHVLYMTVSHVTCAFPAGFACVMHTDSLWAMPAVSAGLAAISAGISIYASTARTSPEPTTEL